MNKEVPSSVESDSIPVASNLVYCQSSDIVYSHSEDSYVASVAYCRDGVNLLAIPKTTTTLFPLTICQNGVSLTGKATIHPFFGPLENLLIEVLVP